MPNYKAAGTKRENDLLKQLRQDGWSAHRTPASMGTMDIIALKANHTPRYIQVKGTAKPFSGFGPYERYDLVAEAKRAGARAELCWWPTFGQPQYFQPEEWPHTMGVHDKEGIDLTNDEKG